MRINIIIYILCIQPCTIAAQDAITTPTGVEIPYYDYIDCPDCELSLTETEAEGLWDEYLGLSEHNNEEKFVLLRGASLGYNCFGYAYYMSTGGEKLVRLMSPVCSKADE